MRFSEGDLQSCDKVIVQVSCGTFVDRLRSLTPLRTRYSAKSVASISSVRDLFMFSGCIYIERSL